MERVLVGLRDRASSLSMFSFPASVFGLITKVFPNPRSYDLFLHFLLRVSGISLIFRPMTIFSNKKNSGK